MGRNTVRTLAAVFAVFAAVPAVADAARVTRHEIIGDDGNEEFRIFITTLAGDREPNLEVTRTNDGGVLVRDVTDERVTSDGSCAESDFAATCGSALSLEADFAGTAGTLVNLTALPSFLTGGPGHDALTGGSGKDIIRGGPGNDALDGAGGADLVEGQAGDDTELGGAGADVLGAIDALHATEDSGRDTFKGGFGSDRLFTNDGLLGGDALIDCGLPDSGTILGTGDLAAIDLKDPRTTGCEVVNSAQKDQHPTVQVRGRVVRVRDGRAAVRLRCPARAPGGRCAGTTEIVKRGRSIASGHYRIPAGRNRTVRLRVRGRARGAAEVRTHELDTTGQPETTRTDVELRN